MSPARELAAVARALAWIAAAVGLLTTQESRAADAPTVWVRATPDVRASAFYRDGDAIVRGRVTDDRAAPLAGARVRVRATRPGATTPGGWTIASCDRDAPPLEGGGHASATLDADEAGVFCARVPDPSARVRFEVHVGALGDFRAIDATFDAIPGRRPVRLRFDPEPESVDLDESSVTLSCIATYEDVAGGEPASGLELVLRTESNPRVAVAKSDASGRAHWVVVGTSIGEPGPGTLSIVHAGSAKTAAAETKTTVLRTARVKLAPVDLSDFSVPRGGTTSAQITAHTAFGAASDGVVTIRSNALLLGSATVADGAAEVTIEAPKSLDRGDLPISIAYVPTSPWLRASAPLAVELHVEGQPAWRSAPFAATVVLVLAIVAWSRRRPKAADPEPEREAHVVEAKIAVRAPDVPGRTDVAGRVIDAHTREPIRDAHVEIVRSSFQGSERLVSVVTDEEGRFACAWPGGRDPLSIRVEARWHAPMDTRLVGPADVDVELITRRRALLDAIVAFSRRSGIRGPSGGEPTPGEVRDNVRDGPMRAWCDATEAAAFGPSGVDHRAHAEVDALRPKAPSPARPPRAD